MTFRQLLVKDLLADPALKAVLEKHAPAIAKSPAAKLMGRKTCGEVFDLVVSKHVVTKEVADAVEAEINELLK